MPLHINILCKWLRVYEWLDQKWLGIHFLFLSKKLGLKIPVVNSCLLKTTNSSLAWQVCGLLKYQLCFIGVIRVEPTPARFRACLVVLCFERRWHEPNTIACLKSKYLAPPKILGWLRYCCAYFVDPTFPEPKSVALLKLCMNL